MSSQSPTLPPSLITGASAQSKIDQIAIRIIHLPESGRDDHQPSRLSGTVAYQNPDGTLNIKTDKGDLTILLRDKGTLPQGLKIDIEIPAGRNPQNAVIKHQTPSALPEKPNLVTTLDSVALKQNTQSSAPVTSSVKLQPETLGNIIVASQSDGASDIPLPVTIAGGTIQAGQIVRLVPIPPGSIPRTLIDSLTKPVNSATIISQLIDTIENLPKTQSQLRTTLITLLSRLDFSLLTQPLHSNSSASLSSGMMTPPQLLGKIDQLIKSIGLPTPFQTTTGTEADLGIPLKPSSSPPTSFSLFNPSKSVDGQILVLPNAQSTVSFPHSLVTSLSHLNTPVSPAQVMGFTNDGLPILSVPLPNTGLTQMYALQFKANNLSAGTPVFMALDPTSTKATNALFIQSIDGSISLNQTLPKSALEGWINSGTWDSLDDLMKNLSHFAPQSGQAFAHMMPNPAHPNTMAALSLFFLSLMRSGDTDGWIANETINLMRQMGKADMIRSATSDLNISAKLENIVLSQDWRMMMLPMLWDNQVHKMPVYYKHLPDDDNKADAEAKKRRKLRFLFDLNLSRMGGVQVDGFMQSERLDIILRTKSPLSPPMQGQMKRIYAGAMDKSRLTGDLSFQFKPEHWVDLSHPHEKTGLHA